MKAAIVGAGQLGAPAASTLARAGVDVRLFDRNPDAAYLQRTDPTLPARTRSLDAGQASAWRAALEEFRPDVVVCALGLLGAPSEKDPGAARRLNVEIPVGMAAIARDGGVRRFVHMSSFGVYGHGSGASLKETTPAAPTSVYGRMKVEAERALGALAGPAFEVVSLRIAGGYGPTAGPPLSLSSRYLHSLMERARRGEPVGMDADDQDVDEFVFSADVGRLAGRLATAELPMFDVVANLGSGRRTTCRDIVEALRRVWPDVRFTPERLWPDFTPMPPLDLARLGSIVGAFELTSLADGLSAWRAFRDRRELELNGG